jgi:hypothetical protein
MFGFCLNTRWKAKPKPKNKTESLIKVKSFGFLVFLVFFFFFFGLIFAGKSVFFLKHQNLLKFFVFSLLVLQNQETQGTFCVSSKKHKNSRVFLIFG